MVLNLVGHCNAKDATGFSRLKGAKPTIFQAFSLKTLIVVKISVLHLRKLEKSHSDQITSNLILPKTHNHQFTHLLTIHYKNK